MCSLFLFVQAYPSPQFEAHFSLASKELLKNTEVEEDASIRVCLFTIIENCFFFFFF